GRSRPVSGQDLGTLLHDHRSLRLVVLNSCEGARTSPTDPFAGAAQSLVQQGIPAVIAMQFEITDEAAMTLSHEFYAALADGYPVDTALGEARKAIFASGNEVEWATPVLYMRSPTGRIFRMSRPQAAESSPATQSTPIVEMSVAAPPATEGVSAPTAVVTRTEDPHPTLSTALANETESTDDAPSEKPALTPKPTVGNLPARLILIGAAIALVGSGQYLNDEPGLGWFVPEKLLAIAGAAAIAFLALKGKEPRWGFGAVTGLGLYLLAVTLPFVVNKEYGLLLGNLGLVIGAGLMIGAGIMLMRRSAESESRSVGWVPALGGLIIGIAVFLPVTSSDGPEFFAEMGDWIAGNRQAVFLPLLLLAAGIFLSSLYPSRRPSQQTGLVLALGAELLVFFPSMAGYATVVEGWGANFGLVVGVIGALVVTIGTVRAIRRAESPVVAVSPLS
ncbi:MAG: CHAT domain-containing protein, partial [bacterium]